MDTLTGARYLVALGYYVSFCYLPNGSVGQKWYKGVMYPTPTPLFNASSKTGIPIHLRVDTFNVHLQAKPRYYNV
jgi:hypothetical protein